MSARVLFRDSQGRDGQVDLTPSSPLYVGRALDCAIRTDDAMVSRKHSMIRMENGRFYVEDLGSSNGTHVNDVRVTKHLLNHNDVVRCGSLWLRYVEDGPMAVAAPVQPQASPPKRGGTIRLDPNAGPGGPGPGSGAGPGPAAGAGPGAGPGPAAGASPAAAAHAAVSASPGPAGQLGSRTAAGGFGQAPAAGGAQSTSYGSGPASAGGNGGAVQARSDGQGQGQGPFGGPPPMPDGVVGGDFLTPARQSAPNIASESSVVVDMAAGEGPKAPDAEEVAKLKHELQSALAQNEELQAHYDREVADGKRLRAEIVTHKDRVDELRRGLTERDEVVEAHGRVADELREEIRQAKDALASARGEAAELSDLVAARERQISRAQEDIGQLKGEIEDKERQLAEVQRTKDEGWKKLNEQLTEIEHLREVINQQERMLEERRVGLVSQEEIIKELRTDKENHLRISAQMKAERDELKADFARVQAQVGAIDEENRRLTQLLAEARSRGSTGSQNHEVAAHTQAASAELKSLRIALKTVESERDHHKELVERTQDEVERLRERMAGLEVDLREANEKFEQVNAGKSVSDDAMARAELARHKASEEVVAASLAREEAERRAEQALRELDKARAQLAALDKDTAPGTDEIDELTERARKLDRQLQEANDRIAQMEAELRTSKAEREAAERKSRSYPAVTAEDIESTAVVSAEMNPAKIKDRAIEVHDAINDVLSELRNNAMILQDSFEADPAERSEESVRIMREAIDSVVGQAEEAKGTLRRLRELVEFGGE